jgi:pre-rRNA-processing protein IPI1
MGKTSESIKGKKKDFQKIKFKVGKKLNKNTNDTRTNFKAKTLIIKQQFHEEKDKDGLVSNKNLNWKVIN